MKMSKVMLIAVFLTAIILVVVGSVLAMNVGKQTVTAREAEYSALIDQANQQLEQANADLQSMQQQLAQFQQGGSQPAPAAQSLPVPGAAVSPQQAAQIAGKAVDGQPQAIQSPELVEFEGKPAYEVPFDAGLVYVDASSGEVLFNGTLPLKIDAKMAAQVASDYLKDKRITQVDQITFRGQPLFRVIFASGTIVYMDESGQITYINKGTLLVSASSGGDDDDSGGEISRHDSDDDHDDDDDDD